MASWKSLGFCEKIMAALNDLGFKKPTSIQALTLPPAILGYKDIVGAAETGSGKTLAFGLPIVHGILNIKNNESKDINYCRLNVKPLYALILTPTRELAVQIQNHLKAITKYTDLTIAVLVGGLASVKQERVLSKSPEIVVATPGRLWELIQEGNKHLSQVDHIKYLAIDETDRMLECGHFLEMQLLMNRINKEDTNVSSRQTFIFSATLTFVHTLQRQSTDKNKIKRKKFVSQTSDQKLQNMMELIGIKNPKIVDITQQSGTVSQLTECRIICSIDEKDFYLYYFLMQHPGRTIIFCNSIGCVKRLSQLFTLLRCAPLSLFASLQQKQRLKNLERFQKNTKAILIATDVAARGLDIPDVEHVIHYQVPRTTENYVHRSGRTARATKEGISVLLMEPSERYLYSKICLALGRNEDLPLFPVSIHKLNAVKKRVNLARDIDICQLQMNRTLSKAGWLQKAAEEMDIILDDKLKIDLDPQIENKRFSTAKQKQLEQLLNTPLFPRDIIDSYMEIRNKPTNSTIVNSKGAVGVMKNAIKNYKRSKASKKADY